MLELDVSKLVKNKSIIYHNLYHDGRFIESGQGIIRVQFKDRLTILSMSDHQKSWHVKNYDGFQFGDSKIFDSSPSFEKSFLKSTIEKIDGALKNTKDEIYYLPDGSDMNERSALVRDKSRLETRKILLNRMKKEPYFARIDMVSGDRPEMGVSYYIRKFSRGKQELGVDPDDVVSLANIVDWRSLEASPYYFQEDYTIEDAENRLVLRRDYEIRGMELSYKDDLISDRDQIAQVADERLRKHIQLNRDKNIREIIQTIQTKQYRIITHNQDSDILVQGCAGSGKTMILAHRLSFWMFRLQDQLDICDAFIISPTKLLSREMMRLELDIDRAKFMTNIEFNEYLVRHICAQLKVEIELEQSYLSNNMVDDDFIRVTYSDRYFDRLQKSVGILLEKTDGGLVGEFVEFAKLELNQVFNRFFSTKKPIDPSRQEVYEAAYVELKGKLDRLTYLDLLDYRNRLLKADNDLKDQSANLTNVKRELKQSKSALSMALKDLSGVHPDLSDLKPVDAPLYLAQWQDGIEGLQNEIAEFTVLLAGFEVDKTELALLEGKYRELLDKKQHATFFSRRRIARETEQWQEKLTEKKKQLDRKYASSDLSINGNDETILARVAVVRTYLETERSFASRIQTVVADYQKAEMKLAELKESMAKAPFLSKKIDEHLRLVQSLIRNRSIITNEKRNEKGIESLIEELLQVKLPVRLTVANYVLKYHEYLSSREYRTVQEYTHGGDTKDILMMVIRFVIEEYKKQNGIDGRHYEFEVFMILRLLHNQAKIPKIINKWVFIDEFQDYSYSEIAIYKSLFHNSPFNYFGDMNQNIAAKGLTVEELDSLLHDDHRHFEINENYRNAKEITDYVNSEFNLNMYSIGLEGAVVECSLESFLRAVDLENSESVALVVDNLACLKNLDAFRWEDYLVVVDENEPVIVENKVNVLTPVMVKGLEFDTVAVMADSMKDNERYVSFTRALKNLYVIKDTPQVT